MCINKDDTEVILILTKKEEYYVLYHIYQFRSITAKQIKELMLLDFPDLTDASLLEILDYFLRHSFIESVSFDFNSFSFRLTKAGYDILKQYIENEEVYVEANLGGKKIADTSLTFSKYQLKEKLLKHQVHLNHTVVNVMKKLKESDELSLNDITYFDEKVFMPDKNINTRPDGVIIYNDKKMDEVTMYFLEQDMSTESMAQLASKWNGYYELIKRLAHSNVNSKITINTVFIGLTPDRLKVVREGLYSHISLITQSNVEFSLVTEEEASDFILKDMENIQVNSLLKFLSGRMSGYEIKSIEKAELLTNGSKNYILILVDEINSRKLTQLALIEKYLNLPEYSFLFILKDEDSISSKQKMKQLLNQVEINESDFNEFKYKMYFSTFDLIEDSKAIQVVNTVSFESQEVDIA